MGVFTSSGTAAARASRIGSGELSVEAYALQSSPDRAFRIGNVVLLAPDAMATSR